MHTSIQEQINFILNCLVCLYGAKQNAIRKEPKPEVKPGRADVFDAVAMDNLNPTRSRRLHEALLQDGAPVWDVKVVIIL